MGIISLLQYTLGKVIETFSHNWYLLLISILISTALTLYVDQDAIAYALGWRPQFSQTGRAQNSETPLEILKSRYARGEISREEYEQMRRDLEG